MHQHSPRGRENDLRAKKNTINNSRQDSAICPQLSDGKKGSKPKIMLLLAKFPI